MTGFILLAGLLSVTPASVAQEGMANVDFEAPIPATTVALAASADARAVAVVDEEARFTFIPGMDSDEQTFLAPKSGKLSAVDPTMGEIAPTPLGIAVTPKGDHWAGTVRYDDEFGGIVWGFARWSDEPIWRFDLSDGSQEADQPTVLTAGGGYIAVGTERGHVYLLKAAEAESGEKRWYRNYKADNDGNRFAPITDVALARDGSRILIGTESSDIGTVHLYSDRFIMGSFSDIKDRVQNLAISADGTRAAVATGNDVATRIHFLDLDRGRTLWAMTLGEDVPGLAVSADGGTVVAGTEAGNVVIFHNQGTPDDRDPAAILRLVDPIDSVSVADDGRAIAAGTAGGDLYFIDRDRDDPLWSHDAGSAVIGTALAADAETLVVSASRNQEARVIYTTALRTIDHVVAPQPRLPPGATTTVPVEVANNGNRMAHLGIAWESMPEGWAGLASNVTLAPGEVGRIDARIDVANGQAPGAFPVRFAISGTGVEVPVAITAVVPEMTSGRTTERWSLPMSVPGGAPAAFLLRMENTGNTPNAATLGYAKLPAGWRAEFVGASTVAMKAGEDREVALKVWAPEGTPVGREASFDVVLAWDHGEERLPLVVRLVDAADYRAALQGAEDEAGALGNELIREAGRSPTGDKTTESEDSPAAGPALLVLTLLGLLVWTHRRR